MKKTKIKDVMLKSKVKERKALIQGTVPYELKKRIKVWLKETEPKRTWNDFVHAACISFLDELKK